MTPTPNSRVALITGAGRHRVGSVIATMLAGRGFQVALGYHRSAEAVRETVEKLTQQGVRAEAFQADVSVEAEVDRLFDEVATRFGRLDVLVTAAAIWEPKPLEQVTAADVRRHFEINALGTFLCCRRGGLIMAGQPEGGAIVTVGDWAIERPYPDSAAYMASKGAIPTITRTMAVELARRNPAVRVNCVMPGPVMLPPDLPAEEARKAIGATLVRRQGRPEHVGQAVIFLVENDFVTGACLPVDGGRTIGGAE
jgi:pteridine reductase